MVFSLILLSKSQASLHVFVMWFRNYKKVVHELE